jgi:hypothetical protein
LLAYNNNSMIDLVWPAQEIAFPSFLLGSNEMNVSMFEYPRSGNNINVDHNNTTRHIGENPRDFLRQVIDEALTCISNEELTCVSQDNEQQGQDGWCLPMRDDDSVRSYDSLWHPPHPEDNTRRQ